MKGREGGNEGEHKLLNIKIMGRAKVLIRDGGSREEKQPAIGSNYRGQVGG